MKKQLWSKLGNGLAVILCMLLACVKMTGGRIHAVLGIVLIIIVGVHLDRKSVV